MKNPLKNLAPLKEMAKPSEPTMEGNQQTEKAGEPSMKELQEQTPERVNAQGQKLQRPRLAQGRKKQPASIAGTAKKSALKKAAKYAVPALASLGGIGGTLFFAAS